MFDVTFCLGTPKMASAILCVRAVVELEIVAAGNGHRFSLSFLFDCFDGLASATQEAAFVSEKASRSVNV